jgi:hypothetical protein
MKRVTYIFLLLAFFFSQTGCFTKGQIEGEDYLSNAFSKNDMQMNLILFFPDMDSKLLVPEDRLVKVKGSVERTVVEEIIKGPASSGKKEAAIKKSDIASVTKKEDTVTVSLSRRYLSGSKLSEYDEVSLYAIVNSLTELPGIKKVVFKTKNKTLTESEWGILFNNPVSRNRSLLNRNCSLNPREVLNLQMTCEKQNKWLDAYMLMSDDENNTYRKSYDDYVREMYEVSESGFTEQKFSIEQLTNQPSTYYQF